MKSLIQAAVVATLIAAPALSFAQSDAPVSRAQVKAELAQFVQANPHTAFGKDPYYPDNVQATEAQIAQQNGNASSAYGGTAAGSSASGSRISGPAFNAVYFGR
jgi:hypothetical protein